MAVRAVTGKYPVAGFECLTHAGAHALLADRQMDRTAHFLFGIAVDDFLLDPPDAQHRSIEAQPQRHVIGDRRINHYLSPPFASYEYCNNAAPSSRSAAGPC